METALKFSGYVGIVLIVFGVLGGILAPPITEQPLLVAHIVLGLLCLIAWGVTSGVDGFSKAGAAITGRTAKFGANAFAYSVVALGLLVVANLYVSMNDKRWDLTEAGVYSLSEKSTNVVKALNKKLKLVAVDAPQIQDKEKTEALLKLYKAANSEKVSFEMLDPRTKPLELDRLDLKTGNLLYLEYGDAPNTSVSRLNAVDEQSVTNAVLKLSRGAAKKIYYLQGHGEPDIETDAVGGMKEFAGALSDEHLTVAGLLLAQAGSVPEDAAGLIVASPKKPLSQEEKDAIYKYVDGGGRLILTNDAEVLEGSDSIALAEHYGITIGRDVIIDEQMRLFSGPQMAVQFVAQQFGAHPITSKLSRSEPPVFSYSSSVTGGKSDGKSSYTELLKSGPKSWAEKNLKDIFSSEEPTASLDPLDLNGPVTIAVALERKLSSEKSEDSDSFDKASRVIVFGDSTWMQNGNLAAMGKRNLAVNVMNWCIGEEGGVAIAPKNLRASTAPMRQETFNLILAFSFLGPELILLFGLYVWWRRRSPVST